MDALLLYLSHGADAWAAKTADVGPLGWVLFFAPLLFLEIPQYYLPLLGVLFLKKRRLSRNQELARKGLLARAPLVSVIVAGRNEEGSIRACIESLLDQDYPNMEILVVDDHSEDGMHAIARRYQRRGLIRLVRNVERGGRTGRPPASNLGMRLANGEFIVSLDADTTFDRGLIENLIAPFADPAIGVVAGNVLVRNGSRSLVARLQSLEYFVSIDLQKRWTERVGSLLQASGAIGAFRREALVRCGGWDPELAEDADLSLRLVKSGWKLAFAPRAVAMTDAPTTLRALIGQRTRWDRGALRTYFAKHGRLLRPSFAGGRFAYGMWGELVFSTILPLMYPFYAAWLLAQGLPLFLFVLCACWAVYTTLSLLPVLVIAKVSERVSSVRELVLPALLAPVYRTLMRWVKIRALVLELLRVRYEDGYLPRSAWFQAPRY